MELVKTPVPEPSTVLLLPSAVGVEVVPQQTPAFMTVEPPSLVTSPPQVAEACVTSVTGFVVTAGTPADFTVADTVKEPFLTTFSALFRTLMVRFFFPVVTGRVHTTEAIPY